MQHVLRWVVLVLCICVQATPATAMLRSGSTVAFPRLGQNNEQRLVPRSHTRARHRRTPALGQVLVPLNVRVVINDLLLGALGHQNAVLVPIIEQFFYQAGEREIIVPLVPRQLSMTLMQVPADHAVVVPLAPFDGHSPVLGRLREAGIPVWRGSRATRASPDWSLRHLPRDTSWNVALLGPVFAYDERVSQLFLMLNQVVDVLDLREANFRRSLTYMDASGRFAAAPGQMDVPFTRVFALQTNTDAMVQLSRLRAQGLRIRLHHVENFYPNLLEAYLVFEQVALLVEQLHHASTYRGLMNQGIYTVQQNLGQLALAFRQRIGLGGEALPPESLSDVVVSRSMPRGHLLVTSAQRQQIALNLGEAQNINLVLTALFGYRRMQPPITRDQIQAFLVSLEAALLLLPLNLDDLFALKRELMVLCKTLKFPADARSIGLLREVLVRHGLFVEHWLPTTPRDVRALETYYRFLLEDLW